MIDFLFIFYFFWITIKSEAWAWFGNWYVKCLLFQHLIVAYTMLMLLKHCVTKLKL